MVRVTHDGVNYFPPGGPLMPGTTTAELTVYDSAKKVDGLSQTVEVDRYQSDGKQLEGIALYAIRNQSQPPRTVADDKHTFEFVLPDGAEVGIGAGQGSRRAAHRGGGFARPAEKPLRLQLPSTPRRDAVPGVVPHARTAARPASRPSRSATCSTSS